MPGLVDDFYKTLTISRFVEEIQDNCRSLRIR